MKVSPEGNNLLHLLPPNRNSKLLSVYSFRHACQNNLRKRHHSIPQRPHHSRKEWAHPLRWPLWSRHKPCLTRSVHLALNFCALQVKFPNHLPLHYIPKQINYQKRWNKNLLLCFLSLNQPGQQYRRPDLDRRSRFLKIARLAMDPCKLCLGSSIQSLPKALHDKLHMCPHLKDWCNFGLFHHYCNETLPSLIRQMM